jgi:hypothetical protein
VFSLQSLNELSQDTRVTKLTGYGLNDADSIHYRRWEEFSLSHIIHIVSMAHSVSVPMDTGDISEKEGSWNLKLTEPSSSTEVRNE